MDLGQAVAARHSVRMYTDEPVAPEILQALDQEIASCKARSGLHLQMASGLDDAFAGHKTHYGRFKGVHNAIALIGPGAIPADLHDRKADQFPLDNPAERDLQEAVGYWGEQLSLTLVRLGLDNSWAVLDDADQGWWQLDEQEHLIWILAFGHGARAGAKHHSKPMDNLTQLPEGMSLDEAPDWFRAGMEAAMLAPTSLGQQPFLFTLTESGKVRAQATTGLFAHVGLGCAKRNFEIGAASAGKDQVAWE
ncbi:nitroreductase [Bifidobacterium aemilianum]|uniref:Nitroreductase n=2 Tax=Bifidobacterium aemilianum TaxID=2493120 RepID=A0A366K8G4_9BIFI|nr:nitroreductase [Bifidobacterium aemilianum]